MIHYDWSMEDYLKHPAISASKLLLGLKTSLDFKEGLDEQEGETSSTTLGTAVHALLLEPKEYDKRYVLEEDFGDKRKAENKKRAAEWASLHEGKIVLGRKEADYIAKLKTRKNTALRLLVASGASEVTGILEPQYDGAFPRKVRADLLVKNTIWDVKTTAHGMDDLSIYKTIKRYHYDFKAAHYMEVLNSLMDNCFDQYGWIFVDTKSPAQHVRMVMCPKAMMDKALNDYNRVISILEDCMQKNVWNGYPNFPTELELPRWAEELK